MFQVVMVKSTRNSVHKNSRNLLFSQPAGCCKMNLSDKLVVAPTSKGWNMKAKLLALLAIVMTVPGLQASPASAMVNACGSARLCIDVYTGSKNYSNRTQYVDVVDVYTGSGTAYLETWGDGFYQTASNSASTRFYIRRWVRSGTYVCGAGTSYGKRTIACIAIRV